MPLTHEDGFLRARDGIPIYHQRWAGAEPIRGVVAIVHGYLEHGGRYGFVVEHLCPRGYRVYAFDQRGHGRSEGRRGYANSFDEYLQDLHRFLGLIQEREGDGLKLFLLGHSFGGLVALRYAIEHPEGLAGLVLSSPYFGNAVPIGAAKLFSVKVLSRVAPTLALETGLDPALLSHDAEVVRDYKQDPLVTTRLTTRWTTETLRAQEDVLARAPELSVPCLILQGAADQVSDPQVSRAVYDRLRTRDREWRAYEGYYHEIFNETGRERVLNDLGDWLEKRL